jgi:hypothetical protein
MFLLKVRHLVEIEACFFKVTLGNFWDKKE